jgi:hypothetical protein
VRGEAAAGGVTAGRTVGVAEGAAVAVACRA